MGNRKRNNVLLALYHHDDQRESTIGLISLILLRLDGPASTLSAACRLFPRLWVSDRALGVPCVLPSPIVDGLVSSMPLGPLFDRLRNGRLLVPAGLTDDRTEALAGVLVLRIPVC